MLRCRAQPTMSGLVMPIATGYIEHIQSFEFLCERPYLPSIPI